MQYVKKFRSVYVVLFLLMLVASQVNALPNRYLDDPLPPTATPVVGENDNLQAMASTDWPQVQYDARRSGYVPQTVGPPYTELWRIGKYKSSATPMFPVSSRVQPIIAENLIFLPSNDNKLYALNTSNGQVAWSYATNSPLVNSAAYASGKVFFGSTDRTVYALNAKDGSFVWSYVTGSTVKTAPLVLNGKVYMGSSDGKMYAFDQATGTKVWEYNIGAPIYDTAAADNGKIFFGGLDSVGYALNADTGALVWKLPLEGQGFRNRWTVAGNGKVIFTPMLNVNHHDALGNGTKLISANRTQTWSVQKQAILDHFKTNPYYQPMFVVNQSDGKETFTPPVLYASGGSMSPHSQVVLLPNGNANVIYRRSFGEPLDPNQTGQTTPQWLYTGELNLTNGDIAQVDTCKDGGGSWSDCGTNKSPHTSDESSTLVRSGDVIYLDIARGTVGLDTKNQIRLQPLAVYQKGSRAPFPDAAIDFYPEHTNSITWITTEDILNGNTISEMNSDANDLKRPTPIVDDVFYILHYNTLIAVRGTKR